MSNINQIKPQIAAVRSSHRLEHLTKHLVAFVSFYLTSTITARITKPIIFVLSVTIIRRICSMYGSINYLPGSYNKNLKNRTFCLNIQVATQIRNHPTCLLLLDIHSSNCSVKYILFSFSYISEKVILFLCKYTSFRIDTSNVLISMCLCSEKIIDLLP